MEACIWVFLYVQSCNLTSLISMNNSLIFNVIIWLIWLILIWVFVLGIPKITPMFYGFQENSECSHSHGYDLLLIQQKYT